MTRHDEQTIAEQAIHWLLRQQEGMTREEQQAFERWLQTPAHQAEYEEFGRAVATDGGYSCRCRCASAPRAKTPYWVASDGRDLCAAITGSRAVLPAA